MPKVAAVSFNLPWLKKVEPTVDENYEETDVEEAKVYTVRLDYANLIFF